MSDDKIFGLDSFISTPSKKMQQSYVQGAEFQTPQISEFGDLEDTHTFRNVMQKYLDDVNTLQHESDSQVQRLVSGETEDLHQVMMAMNEAETSFELMMEIRNKLVSAYDEIMRMQS